MSNEVLGNGRYTVQRRLAAGGMGEVLLANFVGDGDITPGLLVVKRILSVAPGVPPAEGQVRMLLEEGRLGLRLQHDNIVETFRTEIDDNNPLLVIELLAGKSMAQVLGQAKKQARPIPIDIALQVLRGACCGLHFAHTLKGPDGSALGLVHRDVSPANIFVTFDGKVKVIDFGVAKSEDSEVKTAAGILKGKLGYMSPEQSLGSAKLTPQADIWSLGVFFWELLVAERLFASPNPTATLLQITQKEIAPPSTLRSDVPRAVEQLAMKMLTRPLESRFKTCADVVKAIDTILLGRSVDVGGFLAERFPEEAAAGIDDARNSAHRVQKSTPVGLVDGNIGVDPADDDDLATAILPASLREQLLSQVARPAPAPIANPDLTVDDDDDAATVRVDSDILAQVRAMGRQSTPRIVDDEEDIATRRVDPEVMAAARLPPRLVTPAPQTRPTGLPPPPAAIVAEALSAPLSPLLSNGPSTRAPGTNPTGSRPNPQVSTSSTSSTTSSSLPAASPATTTAAWSPPSSSGTRSSTTTASKLEPVRRPPTHVSANLSTPLPEAAGLSWVAVAAATFGALAVVLGIGVAFALPTPAPTQFVAYADPAGYDVVVADASHVPVGRPSRVVALGDASLLRAGELEARDVIASDLEAKLKSSGVWARASLPSSSKARAVALLPLLIVALGALALVLAGPTLLSLSPTTKRALQAVLAIAVVGGAIVVALNGGLGWAGIDAFAAQPHLEWR